MKFVSPLADTDFQALMDAYTQGEKPALRRRVHAIVLSHKGYGINPISDILAVTRETVSHLVRCLASRWPGGAQGQGPQRSAGHLRRVRPETAASPGGRASPPDKNRPGTPAAGNRQNLLHSHGQAGFEIWGIASSVPGGR
ncbi:hypothetical protein [Azotobacter armeniacus]